VSQFVRQARKVAPAERVDQAVVEYNQQDDESPSYYQRIVHTISFLNTLSREDKVAAVPEPRPLIKVGGFVAFTNLSVDLPGRGYQLRFTHPDAGTTSSRTMTQGLTGPTITGPTTVLVGAVTPYDAGPGYSTYEWFLDGNSIAQTRTVCPA
jgi:hypothetical protein